MCGDACEQLLKNQVAGNIYEADGGGLYHNQA